MREDDMRKKLKWMLVVSSVILGAALFVGSVQATPGSGFAGTTIVSGRFDDIDVNNHFLFPQFGPNLWLSLQKTNGPSDLFVQSNTWQLNGHTGWHTHPGHSLIIITAGTVTAYEGDDPSCTPHVYTAPATFVDPGGDHVHLIRNEGSVIAVGYAVQLVPAAIPAGSNRRIDADANPACGF
jgi:hypothetical protein